MRKEFQLVLGWIVIILLVMAIKLHSQELNAQCTSQEFYQQDCKIRTDDDSIYINNHWTDTYIITMEIIVNGKINLYLLRKEER